MSTYNDGCPYYPPPPPAASLGSLVLKGIWNLEISGRLGGEIWLKAREAVMHMHLLRKVSHHFRGDCCHVLLCKNRQ